MKKVRILKVAALLLLLNVMLLYAKPVSVQAAAQQVQINTKKVCKSYDITGDNKKDSIQIKWVFNKYISVIVNGKTIFKNNNSIQYDPIVRYCKFENGMPFLFIESYGINELSQASIVYYKNNKPVGINLDFGKYGWLYGVSDFQISKNSFSIQYSTMTGSTGFTYMPPCIFQYKNGDIKRKGNNVYEVSGVRQYTPQFSKTNRVKTARKLTAYTDSSCKTKAFTVKKGAKVKITKIYYNRKKMLIGVEYNGKFGWIKGITTAQAYTNPLFTQMAFGG